MMKKHFLLTTAAIFVLAFSLVSCGGKMGPLAQDYFKVKPAVLEAKGGVVEASISGKFPEKYFKKKAVVTVTPVLKYNGQEENLEPVTFQGEKVSGNDNVIEYKAGGTYSHKVSFEFKPGMEKAELYLKFDVTNGKKTISVPEVKIADGINCTYMLAKAEALEPVFALDQFQRTIIEQQNAEINFLVAQSNIRSTELQKAEIVELANKLKAINAGQEGTALKSVEISAYASPEGSEQLNTVLAEKREKVAVDYINRQLKQLKGQAEIDSRYTPEDWEGFQTLVSQSSIQDKELILSVLSQFSDPAQRETEIRKLSAAYKMLATDILPVLRRSKMKVSYELTGKSDEELIAIANSNPDSLNVEELLYAASLINDPADKKAIYEAGVRLFPGDWRTNTNLGAMKYLEGDLEAAEKLFGKALDLNKTAAPNYNWGLILMRKGELKAAEPFLAKASGLGAKLDAARGIIYLNKGDYEAANKALSADKSNNAAIAKLVVKDAAGAAAIIKEVKNPDALTSYLKAIIAARTSDKENVFSNLQDAAKNSELKKRAAVDIEFAKYRTEPSFTSIVQ